MNPQTPKPMRSLITCCVICLGLVACGVSPVRKDGPPKTQGDAWAAPEPEPMALPKSRYGNPNEYVVFGKRYKVMDSSRGFRQQGRASWYGQKFHGQRTSSGETFDMFALTAAHRELPIPCIARVTNLDNGKSLLVRINDRGPFHSDRILDLSWAAAVRLGLVEGGTGNVRLEVVESESSRRAIANSPPIQISEPALNPVAKTREPAAFNIDAEVERAAQLPRPDVPDLAEDFVPAPAPAVAAALAAPATSELSTPPASSPQYFLQVGAFRDIELAERTRQRFRSLGYPVPDSSRFSGGWYRVWIGPWADSKDAKAHSKTLHQQGYKNLLIAE